MFPNISTTKERIPTKANERSLNKSLTFPKDNNIMSNTERTILKIINDTIESSSKPTIFVDKFRVTYYRFTYRSE